MVLCSNAVLSFLQALVIAVVKMAQPSRAPRRSLFDFIYGITQNKHK
jgi:hypothetical protein